MNADADAISLFALAKAKQRRFHGHEDAQLRHIDFRALASAIACHTVNGVAGILMSLVPYALIVSTMAPMMTASAGTVPPSPPASVNGSIAVLQSRLGNS